METSAAAVSSTISAVVASQTNVPPPNHPPPRHANPVVAFIIGLSIILLASIMNAAGLNLTKLDHVRMSAVPKTQRTRDWMRPLWLLGMLLYILSQLIGSTLALEYMRAEYVAPLGSSSLVFNFLFARFLVGTPVTSNDIYGTVVVVLGVIGIVAFGSINSGLSQETNAEHLAQLWRRGGWLGYFFAMGAALSLLLIFTSCLDAVLVARADLQAIPTNRTGLRNSIASASVAGTGRRGFFGKVFGVFFAIRAAWNWTMTWITDMLELWAQPKDDTTVAWTLGIGWACCGGGLAGGTLVFAKATVKLLSGSLSHENPGNQFGHAAPIFNIIFLALTAVMQIVCLNRGLKVYESTLVVPVFYGVYTALGFLDSLIFNDEVGAYKSWTLFLIFLSIIVLISGVVLLTHKKPEPVAAKIKGAATPRSALVMEERRRRRTRAKGTGDEENQALGSDDERVHGEEDTLWAIGDVSDEDDPGQDDDADHHLNPRASPNAKLQRRGSSASGSGRKRAGSSTAPGKGDSESTGLIATVDDEDEDGDDADVEDSEPVLSGKGKAKAKQNRRRSMDPFHDDNGADSSELEVFGLTKGKHR
ncbi:hypothetical protein DFP72DRAFT_804394 [Ephemerocybe angulata]|uniref:Uncharacterized protein n=1 Tax=Ephemerocybe angulata TaxID=980116 RepID=A0A8H6ICE7_9AGAR|nr:hypothetical protein DFP72DRAFT_804394 [Tulosesus angulatus]